MFKYITYISEIIATSIATCYDDLLLNPYAYHIYTRGKKKYNIFKGI